TLRGVTLKNEKGGSICQQLFKMYLQARLKKASSFIQPGWGMSQGSKLKNCFEAERFPIYSFCAKVNPSPIITSPSSCLTLQSDTNPLLSGLMNWAGIMKIQAAAAHLPWRALTMCST